MCSLLGFFYDSILLVSLLLVLPPPPLGPPVDINAQARKLQRNRAKGTLTLPRSSNSSFSRSLSETSLNQVSPHQDSSSVEEITGCTITDLLKCFYFMSATLKQYFSYLYESLSPLQEAIFYI